VESQLLEDKGTKTRTCPLAEGVEDKGAPHAKAVVSQTSHLDVVLFALRILDESSVVEMGNATNGHASHGLRLYRDPYKIFLRCRPGVYVKC
jgi:hypothetical protein